MRIRSGKEFTYESFKEGIDYAHARGKKVYVTINGFPFNAQIKLLKQHIEKMAALEPDAFIVASVGVISLIREIAPQIPIHVSTQANVINYLDAKVFWDMGVKRIVAARETSLKDLKEIKAQLPDLEIEIFAHGSMCFAYSGRCLISALQSGRVPNRGSCANDCRFPYEIYAANENTGTLFKLEEDPGIGTYIMNSKDLNLASHIKEILDSGCINTLKIEGRTKSPYYAAITARTYRQAIDDYYNDTFEDAQKYQDELNTMQNRGFTDAYLIHRPFEKNTTQNHDFTMQFGTHQVNGLVTRDGKYFMCKHTTLLNESYEIVAPNNASITCLENEIGKIYEKEGRFFITFSKLLTESGKELDSIHSGNTNPVVLPGELPASSFFRFELPKAEQFQPIAQ